MWAPNAFTSGINFSGLTIIRCTSNGFEVNLATYFSTGKPKDMFGTNTPSIISMCTQSASLRLIISMSFARYAKSAERIEGDIIGFIFIILKMLQSDGIHVKVHLSSVSFYLATATKGHLQIHPAQPLSKSFFHQ